MQIHLDYRNITAYSGDVPNYLHSEILNISKEQRFTEILIDNGYSDGLIPTNVIYNTNFSSIGVIMLSISTQHSS